MYYKLSSCSHGNHHNMNIDNVGSILTIRVRIEMEVSVTTLDEKTCFPYKVPGRNSLIRQKYNKTTALKVINFLKVKDSYLQKVALCTL